MLKQQNQQIIIEEDREDEEDAGESHHTGLLKSSLSFTKMKAYEEARKGLRHVSQTELSGNYREQGKRSPLPMLRVHNGQQRVTGLQPVKRQEPDPYR
jgi:hypothetical protein